MVDIPGATSSTYALVSADAGHNIAVKVTATNTFGSANAVSASVGPVAFGPADAFLARTSGLDAVHQNAYAVLINGLITDGVWSKFDVLRVYATQNQATALLNLISGSYTATLNGAPTFTADIGFTGTDAANTPYILSNYNPVTATSPKLTQNSCHIATWTLNNTQMTNPEVGFQNSGGTSVCVIYTKYTDGHTYLRPQATGASGGDAGILADKTGLIGANRSSSVQVDGYRNGVSIFSNSSDASTALVSLVWGELSINNQGINFVTGGSQQAAVSWGSSLSATDWANYYARLLTYMQTITVAKFLARTSGLNTTHINAYTALISGLMADGLWYKFDALYIYATQDSTTALLNLVSTSYSGIANGSPAFTVDRGYTGVDNSGTVWVSTQFAPASAVSPKFTQNSGHLSFWGATDTGVGAQMAMGMYGGGSSNTWVAPNNGGNTYFAINGAPISLATAGAQGHYVSNRTDANNVQGYKNGSSIASNSSNTSQAVTNFNIAVVSANFQNVLHGCNAQGAAASIGSSLTATDVLNFYSRLRTYMTAVGVP